MSRQRSIRPWLLALGIALVVSLVWLPGRRVDRDEEQFEGWELLGDRKLQRTARLFQGAPDEGRPLVDYNREGIDLRIDLDPAVLAAMRDVRNRKYYKRTRSQARIRFGAGAPLPASIALRGAGSLDDPDLLSFKVRLPRAEPFAEGVKLRRFFVMSLAEDEHQVETRLATELLREIGLFPVYHQFVSLYLNGEPQGVAMLIEPPDRGIRRLQPDVIAVYRRRGEPNQFRTKWVRGDVPPTQLAALRALSARNRIDDPIRAYADVLDLDAYLAFMAATSILLNGDTLGELFLFETLLPSGRSAPLRPMAWDLEDVAYGGPNEAGVDDPLVFFAEGRIDQQVHRHPELWQRYRRVLADLLDGALSYDRVAAKLREVQALRDAIDDGHLAARQRLARAARARHVDAILPVLRGRQEALRTALADASR
jgi:hypothetical protein